MEAAGKKRILVVANKTPARSRSRIPAWVGGRCQTRQPHSPVNQASLSGQTGLDCGSATLARDGPCDRQPKEARRTDA
jgi:hypothetical protein